MSAFTLIVQIQVKPECVEAFCEATLANARASRQEPGILGFDLLKQQDATDRFLLIEAFRGPEAQQQHRETPHYAVWRDAVASMMAAPRIPLKYDRLEPA